MPTPQRLSFELHTQADLAQTWAVLSDTDRFNRIAGLGFSFEPAPPGAKVRRIGHMKRLGLSLSWDELPFTYEAPYWFTTRRIFHGGPASEFSATLRLKEASQGGTDIRYSVEVTPRNALTIPVVKFDLETSTRKQLSAAFNQLIAELDQDQAPRDLPAPPLEDAAQRKLDQALAQLPQDTLTEQLGALLTSGSLRDQAELSPPTLSIRWRQGVDAITERLLQATDKGLLSVHWEILCPSCRAPQGKLSAEPGELHCDSCEIPFDGALPDSVAVYFRPARSIREVTTPQDCVGSPALTRHILASRGLPGGEEVEMSVYLDPGPYRLRTWPMRGTSSLEVRPEAPPTSLDLDASEDRLDPPLLRAEPGVVTLKLRNTTDKPMRVVLESSWRPEGRLTAGQLLERFPSAGRYLPVGMPVADARSERKAVLALVRAGPHDPRATNHYLKAAGAERVLVSKAGASLAIFGQPEDAVKALRALPAARQTKAGLAYGGLITLGTGERGRPVGQVPEAAMAAARAVATGHVAHLADATELSDVLVEGGLEGVAPWFQLRGAPSLAWSSLS
ncbi:MAG: hypothetical protein VX899_07625 [Myxococcota bacterium]|nr:hypothetical protein [Myxococcota bacterium]